MLFGSRCRLFIALFVALSLLFRYLVYLDGFCGKIPFPLTMPIRIHMVLQMTVDLYCNTLYDCIISIDTVTHVKSVMCSRKIRHIIIYSAASCTLLACLLSVVTGEYCYG